MANQKFGIAMPTCVRPITDVAQLVVARRGVDAGGQRDGGGERHGHDGQRHGQAQPFEHQLATGVLYA
jgi:hypothetical protein